MDFSARATSSLRILANQVGPKSQRRRQSWRNVFDSSGIGAERNLIAGRFVSRDSKVLDVGCGRGFFSFACARNTRSVTSLDVMDGRGRSRWWDEFETTAKLLDLSARIEGVRATAEFLPFGKDCFDLVASVHSIRNFGSVSEIRTFFREARRSIKDGGLLVVVESDLERVANSSYKSLFSMRTRLGWELELPSISQMLRWLRSAGFSEASYESLETDLAYAPVYFPFDKMSMNGMKEEYDAAIRLRHEDGERHPPIFILVAQF